MTVYRSPCGDVALPEISVTEYVFRGLERRHDAPVLIDGPSGRTLTAGAFVAAVKALAGGLSERGLGRGAVVALMAPNLPEFCVIFHAVAWAGGTLTTINPTYTAPEVAHQLKDAGAAILITVPPFLETARAGAEAAGVAEVAVIGEAAGATPLSALMGAPVEAQVPVDLDTHVLVLPYSSGTTGLPKGVMLTHRNLVANVVQIQAVRPLRGDEWTVGFLPFFHIYGMTVLMNLYLAQGGGVVTMPRFELETFLRLCQEHRTRQAFVVPPVVLALAKHPMVDQFDLSALEAVFSGAAPLGAPLAEAAAGRLGLVCEQGYGMTEMSPASHVSPFGKGRPGSSGITLPGTECRIVDPETGEDRGPGEEGELWVRGPQVMRGYLNNPAATAACLDAEGWLRTGDIAAFDADGYVYLHDRLKELIKVKGFQVAPAEVEAALQALPGIADAAVIGVPDDEAGEVPMAFVVAAPGAAPTLEAVQEGLAGQLAHYKQVRHLKLVEAIPKSPSGKILRRLLRAGTG
jgi:4-coumarate--CoA ligase